MECLFRDFMPSWQGEKIMGFLINYVILLHTFGVMVTP